MKLTYPAALAVIAVLAVQGPGDAQEPPDTLAAPRCEYGQPHPDYAEQLAPFSFLIGDYVVTGHIWLDPQQGWSPPRPGVFSRWVGYYGLNGTAIYDEWFNQDLALDPASGGGVNVRLFDPDAGVFKMMWIATGQRQVTELTAQLEDGVLTMRQVYPERDDFYAEFFVEDENNWHRIDYRRDDESGAWRRNVRLNATRLPC
jgi:hypothetical protein